jgi:aminocarboxymuconate-semialdehyde decarboxylase
VGVDGLGHAPDKLDLDALMHAVENESYLFVVHPAGHEPGPNSALDDFALAPAFETMLWTSLVGLRLALSGTLDRFPKLDVVVPHLGGVIPYLTQRLVDQTVGNAEHDLTHYLTRRLYYDNCSYHAPALRCAADTVGAERIMLGSDYPFRGELRRCVDDVSRSDFGDAQKRAMLGGTAARWFDPARG